MEPFLVFNLINRAGDWVERAWDLIKRDMVSGQSKDKLSVTAGISCFYRQKMPIWTSANHDHHGDPGLVHPQCAKRAIDSSISHAFPFVITSEHRLASCKYVAMVSPISTIGPVSDFPLFKSVATRSFITFPRQKTSHSSNLCGEVSPPTAVRYPSSSMNPVRWTSQFLSTKMVRGFKFP